MRVRMLPRTPRVFNLTGGTGCNPGPCTQTIFLFPQWHLACSSGFAEVAFGQTANIGATECRFFDRAKANRFNNACVNEELYFGAYTHHSGDCRLTDVLAGNVTVRAI
jgi:hypothetical protein